jgi:PAS domain S-box-containing protein
LIGLLPAALHWLLFLPHHLGLQPSVPEFMGNGSLFGLIKTLAIPLAIFIALFEKTLSIQRSQKVERKLLRAVFNSIPDLVYLKDKDSVYVEVNRRFEEVVGSSAEAIHGHTDLDFFSAETAAELRIEDIDVLRTGKPWHAIKERKRHDGQARYFDTTKLPFHDADGTVIGVLGNARDITEQMALETEKSRLTSELAQSRLMQKEAELKIADDRANLMMQVLGDAVVGLDYFNCIDSMNPAAERLLGLATGNVLGRNFHELTQHKQINTESGTTEDHADLMKSMQEHSANHGTATFIKSDGTQLIGEYFYQPLVFEGTHRGAVMVIRDVTEKLAIEKQLRFLSRAVEDSPAAVMMTDENGVITYVNHRFEALYGYKKSELLNQSCENLLPSSLSDQKYSEIGEKLNSGQEWIGELEGRHRNGNALWTRAFLTPLKDTKGHTTHYLMLSEDTTLRTTLERRERAARRESDAAHRRLAEQEQFLRLITEHAPAQIVYVDSDERVTFCNHLAAELFGRAVEDIVGFQLIEVCKPVMYDFVKPYYDQAMKGDALTYTSPTIVGKIIETYLVADYADDGKVQGVIGLALDITEKRRTAAALKNAIAAAENANLAKSEFLANMSHEIRTPMHVILGLITLLTDTVLDGRQSNYVKKLGNSAQLLLGLVNDILDFSKIEAGKLALEVRPFSLDEVIEKLADLFSDTAAENGLDLTIDIAPGTPEFLSGDAFRLTQVLVNLCSNALKFTQAGEVLIRIAGVSQGGHRAEIEFSVTDTGIGMSAEKADRIFDAFSQADSSTTRRFGGTGLGLTICRDLVSLMGGQLRVQSRLNEGSCFYFSLGFEIPPALNPVVPALQGKHAITWVNNPNKHTALLNHLHTLGVKTYDVNSTEAVRTQWAATHSSNGSIDWLFTDTSTDSAQTLMASLSPCSNPGQQLVLLTSLIQQTELLPARCLTGPITRERLLAALQPDQHEPVAALSARRALSAALGAARILIVDDNPMNHEIIRAYLSDSTCQVFHAANGTEALEVLGRQSVDAVLMDCQMPVMDGYEATRRVRQNPQLASLPIIALTANATETDRGKCLAAGMDAYLAKPVLVDNLLETLTHYINRSAPRQPLNIPRSKPPVKTEGTPDFSPLIGIDLASALRTSMGNANLLKRLLQMFQDAHLGFAAEFRQAVTEQDWDCATRLAHSVKGDAASIGAQRLKQAAFELEHVCRTTRMPQEIDKALDDAKTELIQVLGGIAVCLTDPTRH